MPAPGLVIFVLLVVLPIGLAAWQGGRLVDAVAARRRRHQSLRRRRATRALPLREDAIRALLLAEDRRLQIETRIADALSAFARLGPGQASEVEACDTALVEAGEAVLRRESAFADVVDAAWIQSETIELLTREVSLLRGFSRLEDPSPGRAGRPIAPPRSPQQKLLASVERASRRRAEADRRLRRLSPPEAAGASTGSRLDITIDDGPPKRCSPS